MPDNAPWTVGRLLQWTTGYLQEHGAESPRLDAEVLLADVLGCPRIELYTAFGNEPDEQARGAFRRLVRQRAEGTPVAYLVGHREFYSLRFCVTPDVLIPRPETEFLVVAILDLAEEHSPGEPIAVCDVGTGSGNIAVCVAKHLDRATVTAVDISVEALEIARQNAVRHGVEDRVEFLPSDLLSAIPAEQRFHFIVSNPPYVAEGELADLPVEVRQHEPHIALVAGRQGTEVIQTLLPQAIEHLHVGGHLLLEVSPLVHDSVRDLLADDTRLELLPTVKDLARLPRVVPARRLS